MHDVTSALVFVLLLFKLSEDDPLTRDASGTFVVFCCDCGFTEGFGGFAGNAGLAGKTGFAGRTGFLPTTSLLLVRRGIDPLLGWFSLGGEAGFLPDGTLGGFLTGGLGDCLLRLSEDSLKLE